MKIKITREMKINLLKALQDGYLDTNILHEKGADSSTLSMTDEEIKQISDVLEAKY